MITRRAFLGGLTAAGVAGALGAPRPTAAEPPPETSTLRLVKSATICFAPQYSAGELLQAEGFAEVRYVASEPAAAGLATGEVDLSFGLGANHILRVDAGDPVVLLAGGHVGCFELFGSDRVRTIRDLKGRSVAVPSLGSGPHVFLSSMLAYVGLDPRRDVRWVTRPFVESIGLLADKKVDGFLGFPPEPQEMRARKIGRVIVNTAVDRPWSQYYCCMIAGNREFVRKHPVATKRALRAILKAADICSLEPDRVARLLVDKGYTKHLEYARQTLQDIPYRKWREYDPEDTVRFYALRLHEAGMVKSSPQKIIAQGTDWRFLTALKKELKG